MPFFILIFPSAPVHESNGISNRQVSWLPDKSYLLRLPIQMDSDILQLSFPDTVAGPQRLLTAFPFKAHNRPPNSFYNNSIIKEQKAL